MKTRPDSRHCTLERLAHGVWAAVRRIGGWAVGNAGTAAPFVPGHGSDATADDVHTLQAHIRALIATAERLHCGGLSVDDEAEAMPEDASAEREFAYPCYPANLRRLLGRLGRA